MKKLIAPVVKKRRNWKLGVEPEGLGRIIQVFQNADLRYGLPGLSLICKKYNIPLDSLSHGEYVVFINTAQTMVKVIAGHQVVAQFRRDKGQRIDLNTIAYIPQCFMAHGALSYDEMLKDYFEEKLKK